MEKLTRALLAAAAVSGVGACAHAPVSAPPDGTTRIECAGEAGDEVLLVGTLDGWGAGQLLARDPEGRFAVKVSLPRGYSVFACVRRSPDGTVTSWAPVNAPVVESDGFGGENGVFEGAPVTSKE